MKRLVNVELLGLVIAGTLVLQPSANAKVDVAESDNCDAIQTSEPLGELGLDRVIDACTTTNQAATEMILAGTSRAAIDGESLNNRSHAPIDGLIEGKLRALLSAEKALFDQGESELELAQASEPAGELPRESAENSGKGEPEADAGDHDLSVGQLGVDTDRIAATASEAQEPGTRVSGVDSPLEDPAVEAPDEITEDELLGLDAVALGDPVDADELEVSRGTEGVVLKLNNNELEATSYNNQVVDSITGANQIAGDALNGANGVIGVIQNSGNQTIIQQSTVVNIELYAAPP